MSHFFSSSYRSQVASAAAGDSGTIEELRFVIKKQELEIQSLQEKWQNLVRLSTTDFHPFFSYFMRFNVLYYSFLLFML